MPAISKDSVICISVTTGVTSLLGFLRPAKSFLLEYSNQLFALLSHDSMFDKAIGGIGVLALLVFIFLILFAAVHCFCRLLQTVERQRRGRSPGNEDEKR